MVTELQEAFKTPDKKALYSFIRKVYLVGQNRNKILREVHDTATLDRIFELDSESVPSLSPIHVNAL